MDGEPHVVIDADTRHRRARLPDLSARIDRRQGDPHQGSAAWLRGVQPRPGTRPFGSERDLTVDAPTRRVRSLVPAGAPERGDMVSSALTGAVVLTAAPWPSRSAPLRGVPSRPLVGRASLSCGPGLFGLDPRRRPPASMSAWHHGAMEQWPHLHPSAVSASSYRRRRHPGSRRPPAPRPRRRNTRAST